MDLDVETSEDTAAFARALQKEFGLADSRFLEVELRQMKQEEGESAKEFLRRVRGTATCYPECNDTLIRGAFQEGLRDPEVKRIVITHSAGSLESVADMAHRAEQGFAYQATGTIKEN